MKNYSNFNGDSGVSTYEIGSDYIDVKFNGTSRIYRYSYKGGAGQKHVEEMKALAKNGSGLNGYINSNVKFKYDR